VTTDYDKETIAHMRDLLLRGARMLDEHCPKCGTPLFLIKETNLKYCPKCRVYIATQEELKRAKIDLKNTEIYDFEEYWSKIQDRSSVPSETGKSEKNQELRHEHEERSLIYSTIDEAISALVERLMLKIQREDFNLNELIEVLEKLIEIRKKLER